jgi:myo-inositol 2-dehydrogenase/D-chiro-inositol 1-dehydrogenase
VTVRELRIGFVGCGRATEDLHVPALRRVDGVRVVAIADTSAAARARVKALVPDARELPSHGDLVADPSVDVVAVSVPPFLHAEVATAALAAGKHVYLEKPLAVTLADAERIRDAASASRGMVALGFNLRSHRLVRAARDHIAGGTLGAMEMMCTSWTCGFHLGREWPAWRLDRALGGGAFNEIAVHHLDLARFLLDDEIDSVTAMTRSGDVVDQDIGITARMRSGVIVSISVSQKTVDGNQIEVYGRHGALSFSCYRADSLAVRKTADLGGGAAAQLSRRIAWLRALPAAISSARSGGDYRGSYVEHWKRFAAVIRGEGELPATLDDGVRALHAVAAAIRSAETGRTVALSEGGLP